MSTGMGVSAHLGDVADLAAEVGGQVAPGDLVWRPPQRRARDGRVVAGLAADVGAQIACRSAGQQDAAEDGPKRLRIDLGAQRGCNRLGDGIGLLGGQAALLDREGGGVTRGEDVVTSGDPSVRVGVDEPVASSGDAAQSWADEAGLGDDVVDGQASIAGRDVQPSGATRGAVACSCAA